MKIDGIPFKQTGYFSKIMCDYLEEADSLKPFYNRFPAFENFEAQIIEKQKNFPKINRAVLSEALNKQYKGVDSSTATKINIQLLKEENTFTIVTGHQLNLFTGPLYFLYKIIATINLTVALKEKHAQYNFVPVYWMATEDHDFDEINYFNLNGKKIQWNKEASGGVGRLDTQGLEVLSETLAAELGGSKNAEFLKELFTNAYVKHTNLTDATRFLANELFKEYGLVIVDGDDIALKKLLIPYVKSDLLEEKSFKAVTKSIEALNTLPENYGIQVNPREINYFYLIDGVRERIIEQHGTYFVNDTKISFTKDEVLRELENHPERFSPNVVCRPLYQEVILPNLCYIGGGGELAYWLELKSYFDAVAITFPMLLLRNSALLIPGKQSEKIAKLDLKVSDLFLKQNTFINKRVRAISNIDIDFSPQKDLLKVQFEALYDLATQTDKSFLGAVKAQEVKQIKGLEYLEKRLLKAQKRKLKDHVIRITELQNDLFPNKSLQERQQNFSQFYLEYGDQLIPALVKSLKPLSKDFEILIF
ncbi:bacillithiol biosynthesis cysteine-adding enzyme BshC [Cellulophaga sp. L1A9]|uniref:bacillithiol biosynthesis cysteine-adding enzyme BshC n=1 Tax=Cellulophaga sp. L1A9 TaxID=2686362 RepID=UPI00131AE10D|nr:bacillithiol biosynthesis cysteine-adding enzyme BshC [Cellulophaga sp. L1A9]